MDTSVINVKLKELYQEKTHNINVLRHLHTRLEWLGKFTSLMKYNLTHYQNALTLSDCFSRTGLSSSMYEQLENRAFLLLNIAIQETESMIQTRYENSPCNSCRHLTRHYVVDAHVVDDNCPDYLSRTFHQILICSICDQGKYRERIWFSEWQQPDEPEIFKDSYFPPQNRRSLPIWFDKLPPGLRTVMNEAYCAFNHEMSIMASIGFRTCLDVAIVEKVGDIGGNGEKTDALVARQIISRHDRPLIDAIFESGNASAHRGFSPTADDLDVSVEILERVIHKLYLEEIERLELSKKAEDFVKRVPPRPPRDKLHT